MTTINDVYEVLSEDPKSYRQICADMGCNYDTDSKARLGNRLYRLKKQGYAVKTENGWIKGR